MADIPLTNQSPASLVEQYAGDIGALDRLARAAEHQLADRMNECTADPHALDFDEFDKLVRALARLVALRKAIIVAANGALASKKSESQSKNIDRSAIAGSMDLPEPSEPPEPAEPAEPELPRLRTVRATPRTHKPWATLRRANQLIKTSRPDPDPITPRRLRPKPRPLPILIRTPNPRRTNQPQRATPLPHPRG